jgi:hypothetical protein
MSFDVKEAWRCIRGMPQFQIAPVIKRLWHDPVWSKVIATGITALIGLVWYFWADLNGNQALLHAPKQAATVSSAVESRFQSQATQGNFCFDYSQNNGVYMVGNDDAIFRLHFSKADDTTIYLYSDGDEIARAKNVKKGETVRFDQFDNTSRVYAIHLARIIHEGLAAAQ